MDPFPTSGDIAGAQTMHADFYRDPRWETGVHQFHGLLREALA